MVPVLSGWVGRQCFIVLGWSILEGFGATLGMPAVNARDLKLQRKGHCPLCIIGELLQAQLPWGPWELALALVLEAAFAGSGDRDHRPDIKPVYS